MWLCMAKKNFIFNKLHCIVCFMCQYRFTTRKSLRWKWKTIGNRFGKSALFVRSKTTIDCLCTPWNDEITQRHERMTAWLKWKFNRKRALNRLNYNMNLCSKLQEKKVCHLCTCERCDGSDLGVQTTWPFNFVTGVFNQIKSALLQTSCSGVCSHLNVLAFLGIQ